jgi:4-amino-4-deoxy-L-arabinose transferase-like glycosyltransferase
MKDFKLTRAWTLFLTLALISGVLLRVLFVQDMEYKEDEEYNFTQTQLIGNTQPWPWYGIPSGVYLVNPGMSIWVFAVLAKLFGIHQPTELATAVQLFALLGMSLIIPFALKWVESSEKKQWLWAFCFGMVNPFLVVYQRKLWPEPFLPFFTLLTLAGWWNRKKAIGAFVWGAIGAVLGQIHMSGFFFAFALFLWTAVFDSKRKEVNWIFWFLGSVLGALPLIPWIMYIVQHPIQQSMSAGWQEIVQLKYWTFWLSDAMGLHLGNTLGINRGPSHWNQISDFVRYPIVFGHATYLNGIAHGVALIASILILGKGMVSLGRKPSEWPDRFIGRSSQTAFVQNSALWGCGIILTLTGVMIRRYYMNVTFPLEFLLLIRLADPESRIGHRLLASLWICQLLISAHFVGYIHVNEGSVQGDYGKAYHLLEKDLEQQKLNSAFQK